MTNRLTPKQERVVEAYVREGSMKGAAASLGITLQTTKNHLSAIYQRLDTTGILQTLFALGWISPPGTGPRLCGWTGECSRAAGHQGGHGAFRELTR